MMHIKDLAIDSNITCSFVHTIYHYSFKQWHDVDVTILWICERNVL